MPQQDAITGPGPPTNSGSETNQQSSTRNDYTSPYDLVADFKPKLHKTRSKIPKFTGILSDQAFGLDDVSRYVSTQVPVPTRMSNSKVVSGDTGKKSLIPRPQTTLRQGDNFKLASLNHIVSPLHDECTPLLNMATDKHPSRLPIPTGNGFKLPPSGERITVSRHSGPSRMPRFVSYNDKTSSCSFNLQNDETLKKTQADLPAGSIKTPELDVDLDVAGSDVDVKTEVEIPTQSDARIDTPDAEVNTYLEVDSTNQIVDCIKTPELDVQSDLYISKDEHTPAGVASIQDIPVVEKDIEPVLDVVSQSASAKRSIVALEPVNDEDIITAGVVPSSVVDIASSKESVAIASEVKIYDVEMKAIAGHIGSIKAIKNNDVKDEFTLIEVKTELDDNDVVNSLDKHIEDGINTETVTPVSELNEQSPMHSFLSPNVETLPHSVDPLDEEAMINDYIDKILDEEIMKLKAALNMNTEYIEDSSNTDPDVQYDVTPTLAVVNVIDDFVTGVFANEPSEEAMNEEPTKVSEDEGTIMDQAINEEAKYIFQEKILSKEIEIRRRIRMFDDILEALLTERSELEEIAGEFNDLNRAVDEFGEQKDDVKKFHDLCQQSQNVESKLPFLPKDQIADLFGIQLYANDALLQDCVPKYQMNSSMDTIIDRYNLTEFQGKLNVNNVQYSANQVSVFRREKYDRFRGAMKYRPTLETLHELPEENGEFEDDGTNDEITDNDTEEPVVENYLDNKHVKHDDVYIASTKEEVKDETECSITTFERGAKPVDTTLDVSILENGDKEVSRVNTSDLDDSVSDANKDITSDMSSEDLTDDHIEIIEQVDQKADSDKSYESGRLDISHDLHELRKTLLSEYSAQAYVWARSKKVPMDIKRVLKSCDKDSDADIKDCNVDDDEDGDVDDLLVAVRCMRNYAFRGHTYVLKTVDQMVDMFIVGSDDIDDVVDEAGLVADDIITEIVEGVIKIKGDKDDDAGSNGMNANIDTGIVKTVDEDKMRQKDLQIERDCIALMNKILEIVLQNCFELEHSSEVDDTEFVSIVDDSDDPLLCLRHLFEADEYALYKDDLNKNIEVYSMEKCNECIGDELNDTNLPSVDLKIDLSEVMASDRDIIIRKRGAALFTHAGKIPIPPRSKSQNDAYNMKADIRLSRSLESLDVLKLREQAIQSQRLSLSTVRCITDRMKEVQNAISCESPGTKSECNVSGSSEKYSKSKKASVPLVNANSESNNSDLGTTGNENDKAIDQSGKKSEEDLSDFSRTDSGTYDSEDDSEEEQSEMDGRVDVTMGLEEKYGRHVLLHQYLTDVSIYAEEQRQKILNSNDSDEIKGFSPELVGECLNGKSNDTVCLNVKGQAVDGGQKLSNELKPACENIIPCVDNVNKGNPYVGEINEKTQIQSETELLKCVHGDLKSVKQCTDPDLSTLVPEAKCIFPSKKKSTNKKWAPIVETTTCVENESKIKRNSYQAIHQTKRNLREKMKNGEHEVVDILGLRIDGTNVADVKAARNDNRVINTIATVKMITGNDLPHVKVAKRLPDTVEKTKREILDKVPTKKTAPVRRGVNIGSYSQQRLQKSLNPHRPLPSIKHGQNKSDGNTSNNRQRQINSGSDITKIINVGDNDDNMVQNSIDFLSNPLPPINPKRSKK